MNKFRFLFLFLFLFTLSGCVEMNIVIDVEKNFDTTVTYEALADENLGDLSKLKHETLVKLGITDYFDNVQTIKKDGKAGIKASKSLGNILKMKSTDSITTASLENLVTMSENKGFFFTTYNVKIDIPKALKDTEIPVKILGDQVKLNATLNIPYALKETNATETIKSEKVNSYTWSMTLKDTEPITASARVPNFQNILISAGLIIITIILVIFLILKTRKR